MTKTAVVHDDGGYTGIQTAAHELGHSYVFYIFVIMVYNININIYTVDVRIMLKSNVSIIINILLIIKNILVDLELLTMGLTMQNVSITRVILWLVVQLLIQQNHMNGHHAVDVT